MITAKTPLMLAEVKEMVDALEERQTLKDYLKTYTKLTKDKAEKLKGEILGLNNPKIGEVHAVKVADFLPTEARDVNKIFNDVSLNEEETNAILEVVKRY